MTLTDWLRNLFPKPQDCSIIQVELSECKQKLLAQRNENLTLIAKLAEKDKQVLELTELVEQHSEEQTEVFYYSGKKQITHAWKNPLGKSIQQPVQNFVNPHLIELSEIARKKKLYLLTETDYDTTVVKAYKEAASILSYRLDIAQFNETERWLTAGESLSTGEGDCEDFSHVICSMLEHIGVPISHVRVCIGEGFGIAGHATIAVKDSTGVWRHLNSTNRYESFSNLKDYPQFGVEDKKSKSNSYNLKVVDYYYNSVIAENLLGDEEALENFIVRNSDKKPDATQFNEETQIAGWCKWKSPSGEQSVPFVVIGINGRAFQTNANGIFNIKIPKSWLEGEKTTLSVSFSKDGYKDKTQSFIVEPTKTSSAIVWMLKG